ncbi:MAG: aerobic carbon-monoxide dehydrogenase medium subunit [Solirubrobacteraceae bacterium]|jgi:carbon-monoxide dehydrogenase medium subunit|nr:aerobic carbon-monoxide dehydrogenase medium subunit [Solirubrobacteraceae bacterium]MEA2244292.1 aerobic carbon-monoxide dehydrogenase medium subunit [Solirubrobacteraceae bacterium]
MIPAEFDYAVAESVDDAIRLLGEGGADARLLAGGHSLLPLMKLRFAAPSLLVDLRKVGELRGIETGDDTIRIGALTRHAELQARDDLGLIATVAREIADQQVRNRGTIGGSLANGDAAADLPAVLLAMGGSVVVRGAGGEREIAAEDLFQGYLTTSIEPGEVLTEVRVPSFAGYGHGYEKFNRRSEDWAIVGVCALVKRDGDVCADVRIGLTHMASTPLRASAAEEALRGQPLDEEHIAAAAALAAEGTSPQGDLNATPDYKRHLARVLTRRALTTASAA